MSDEFRGLLQDFIRRFGLLESDRTPCGTPMPPSDAHALMCLREAGEAGLLQTAIVSRLAIDKSTASRIIGRMVERGHVEAAPATDDGRARPVRLTKKGMRGANEVEQSSTRRFATLLENVPARRRTQVVESLRDIVAALDKLDTESEKPR